MKEFAQNIWFTRGLEDYHLSVTYYWTELEITDIYLIPGPFQRRAPFAVSDQEMAKLYELIEDGHWEDEDE